MPASPKNPKPKAQSQKTEILIIDSAAVLNNERFSFAKERSCITTAEVVSEFRDFRSKALVDNALHNRMLRIEEPSQDALEEARQKARELGTRRLSNADLSIIALAIELHKNQKKCIEVITDDYALQNVLLSLRIPFRPSLQRGITELRRRKPAKAKPDD